MVNKILSFNHALCTFKIKANESLRNFFYYKKCLMQLVVFVVSSKLHLQLVSLQISKHAVCDSQLNFACEIVIASNHGFHQIIAIK